MLEDKWDTDKKYILCTYQKITQYMFKQSRASLPVSHCHTNIFNEYDEDILLKNERRANNVLPYLIVVHF